MSASFGRRVVLVVRWGLSAALLASIAAAGSGCGKTRAVTALTAAGESPAEAPATDDLGVGGATTPAAAGASGDAVTRAATGLGITGASLNARVHPHGAPGAVRFEYGPTAALGSSTAARPLPPKLEAHYHESWAEGVNGWAGGIDGIDLTHRSGGTGADQGFVRYADPGKPGNDANHIDGIGLIHLVQYVYPGTYVPEDETPQALWGGGVPDIRGAKVSMSLRGYNFSARGAELGLWVQSDLSLIAQNDEAWRRANWSFTGVTLTDALMSNNWERVEYRIVNDTSMWSYGGTNIAFAEGARGYVYMPLDDALASANNNLFHMLTNVRFGDYPTGWIDFDEIGFTYRNANLLRPANGGRLVKASLGSPDQSPDDTAKLTDGWRHGDGHAWRGPPQPTAPEELIFELGAGARVHTVQIHQSPEWPSKDIEVAFSTDGVTWQDPVIEAVLPANHPSGANYNFVIARGLDVRPKLMRVRILSGYSDERWGLGEIEAFGDGVPMQTDDDWYDVNADVTGLAPGSTLFYRVVLETTSRTTAGPVVQYRVPDTKRPAVGAFAATRIRNGGVKLEARVNPMGLETFVVVEYGLDTSYGSASESLYTGVLPTPRHVLANLTDLTPGATYHYRMIATNAAGVTTGPDATFIAR